VAGSDKQISDDARAALTHWGDLFHVLANSNDADIGLAVLHTLLAAGGEKSLGDHLQEVMAHIPIMHLKPEELMLELSKAHPEMRFVTVTRKKELKEDSTWHDEANPNPMT